MGELSYGSSHFTAQRLGIQSTFFDTSSVQQFLQVKGEMAQKFREMDWSTHPLGPIEEWDQSLKTLVGLMLRSAFPQFIAWGPDRVFLYNDAYRPILGAEKHLHAFGGKFEDIWREIWPDLWPIIERVDRGESSYFEDLPLYMNRNGYFEQTYFTFSYSPILDDSGDVRGLFCSCMETTGRKTTEVALKRSEKSLQRALQRMEAVFSTMNEGVVFIGPSGRVVRMNDEALKQHGFASSEEMASTVEAFTPIFLLENIDGSPLAFENWPANRVLRGERFSSYEVRLHDKRSGRVWVGSYGGSPVFDENGEFVLGVLTVRDVTKQKGIELKLRESEKRLQQTIETVPQGILRTNSDGVADYFSERFCELVDCDRESLLGWGWAHLIHSDDRSRVLEEWDLSRASNQPIATEFRVLRGDGSYRWFLALANPFFDEQGRLVNYYGTWADIHDEKMARIELELKSDALENSLNGFDIINEKGEFIYANRAYLRMWGYESLDEILGTSPAGHCQDPNVPEKIIRALRETGECNIEFKALRKDGTTFDVKMWARLAYDAEGNEIYPSTSIDITDQKAAEASLRFAKEEAERANALKSAFLANMSHEIRTPLGAMIGFADLLREQNLSRVEQSNYLDILTRNGEQLSIIINDILDLSKVEAGHLALEHVEMDPDRIAEDVVSLLRMKAKEKDLYLEYTSESPSEAGPGTGSSTLITDPLRVRQVLLNLVSNAVKFTQQGGVKVSRRDLLNGAGQKCVVFEIEDTGIGIPEEHMGRIFEMFVQGDGSMTRRFGGTGLGLALSRKLARALGGDVFLKQSALGRGSTFVFSFEDRPERMELIPTKARESDQSDLAPMDDSLAGVQVLVVDDAPDNQQLFHRYLTRYGAVVDSATNGLDGYRKALAGDYDIVLMDLQMPLMDGYTATQKLRDHGYRRPIIALTAHAMSEVRRKCLNVGCNDHLPKPVNRRDLIVTIVRHVTR